MRTAERGAVCGAAADIDGGLEAQGSWCRANERLNIVFSRDLEKHSFCTGDHLGYTSGAFSFISANIRRHYGSKRHVET